MHDDEDAVTISVAKEIVRYLDVHPQAGDSAEGIAHWWLKRQRVSEAVEDVERALDYLVTKGVLTTVDSSNSGKIYRKASGQIRSPLRGDTDE